MSTEACGVSGGQIPGVGGREGDPDISGLSSEPVHEKTNNFVSNHRRRLES